MTDVRLTYDGERVTATGETEAGEEFVDAWLGALLTVLDSGRIVIPREASDEFARRAGEQGLATSRSEE